MPYPLLSTIDSPADLRHLRLDQLPQLCQELRDDILDELACNPGHLASSLGAVELTVALHYVFDTPDDRIVWDVGHQAYGHKILTGRRDIFSTNRKTGGLRPFPSPEESDYDTFACGHASNSISAALGMSLAALRTGHPGRKVVAVIGDGAMSGGLAFEGLNNAADTPNNLLIVLNDNEMSISHPAGGMQRYLHHVHTSSFYNRWRNRLARKMEDLGLLTTGRRQRLIRFNNALKSFITAQQNLFEGLNIRYFGPYDGHDVIDLVRTLRRIKDMAGPKLLHIRTIKGKGYAPAEIDPIVWHAPGRFDRSAGARLCPAAPASQPPRFQDVFGQTLVELAESDPRIVGITPAMLTGCSMDLLAERFPDRTFDVGIAEGHAATFAAGMAKDGLRPFCNIYSAFAQRAYDNIIHDTALLGLPVVFCLDRAGLVGEDGPTHHGVFDIPALRAIPGMVIASPYDECELRHLMATAARHDGPFTIRYPRGGGRRTDWQCPLQPIEIGTARLLKRAAGWPDRSPHSADPVAKAPQDVLPLALLSFGPIGTVAADAIATFEAAHPGETVSHIDLRFAKPLDTRLLLDVAQHHRAVITLEDGALAGGVGSAVLELLADHGLDIPLRRLGIPDRFIEHGDLPTLHSRCGIDATAIVQALEEFLPASNV